MSTVVLSTKSSEYFARPIAQHFGQSPTSNETGKLHRIERATFPGGERYLRIGLVDRTDLIGRDVIIVGSTCTDDDLTELYRIGCAAVGYGARRVIFVIPFLGYSTMERAVRPGEVVTAKAIARMLSNIPSAAQGNSFLFMDLHVSGLLHYFEGNCLRFELYAEKDLRAALHQQLPAPFVFGTADLGRPNWVESYARHFNTDMVFVRKRRRGAHTKVQQVIGNVKGKNVIIYDDMTRTGGSLIKAALAYERAGATSVYAVLSHLALTDPSVVDALLASPIKKIYTTNTHPASQWPKVKRSRRFIVTDVIDQFGDAIVELIQD